MAEDAIEPLSGFVAGLRFDAIPAEAVRSAKTFLVDSLGVALAGSSAPGISILRAQLLEWGGTPEATVLAFGDRLPAPAAALLNGTLIQARDFDDTHHEAIVHVNAGVLPAALAVAERQGGVSGARFLTALVAGIDVACRIGAGITTPVAFTRTGTLAFFGAAAATASLLGLDARTTREAFGIAYAHAAGNMQAVHDGALVKRMHPGFGARAGVTAALLAARGLTGARQVLEGPYGYLPLSSRSSGIARATRRSRFPASASSGSSMGSRSWSGWRTSGRRSPMWRQDPTGVSDNRDSPARVEPPWPRTRGRMVRSVAPLPVARRRIA